MPEANHSNFTRDIIAPLAACITYAVAAAVLFRAVPGMSGDMFWPISLVLITFVFFAVIFAFRSTSFGFETGTVLLTWLVLKDHTSHAALLHLPLIAALAIAAGYRIAPRASSLLAPIISAAWLLASSEDLLMFSAADNILIAAMAAMHIIPIFSAMRMPRNAVTHIDVIMSSYSSNTAHLAASFIRGAAAAGAQVSLHRHHHYRSFSANLTGDALAIAFPVIGWKPPWPLFYWLITALPRGKGKSAFILYSAGGGPENAGFVVWLILTLKGYRVAGRNWGVYPLNVPTVRLGPKRLWNFIDTLLPRRYDIDAVRRDGEDFVHGRITGYPVILWPFVLFIAGIVIDNPVIDRIYRNHVFRKRCNGCGICVRNCPTERLSMANGYPKPKGTCAICFGCVNVCPTNAMQMWLFTEYGNPYPPKWREHSIKK